MTRALDTLARLRRREAEEAKRALAQAMAREAQASATLGQARSAPLREAKDTPTDAADPLARAFAAWLPVAANAIAAAQDVFTRAEGDRQTAMVALAARRASLEAVDSLRAERDLRARRQLARRVQSRMDELGHRLG